jgi:hypothetical protein
MMMDQMIPTRPSGRAGRQLDERAVEIDPASRPLSAAAATIKAMCGVNTKLARLRWMYAEIMGTLAGS